MQFIQEESPGGTMGTALSNVLNFYTQKKLADVQKQQQASQIAPYLKLLNPDITQEQINAFPYFDPKIQQEIIKQGGITQRGQAFEEALGRIPGMGQPQTQPEQYPTEGQPQGTMGQAPSQFSTQPGQQPISTKKLPLSERDFKSIVDISQKQQGLNLRKEIAEKKLAQSDQRQIDKETFPYVTDLKKEKKTNTEIGRVVGQMRALEKEKGGLVNPIVYGLLNKLPGLINPNPKALLNPQSQEYEKLESFFLRNLKNIFGGRVTNIEVTAYMKGIPTLMNTPEGREKIYKDLELMRDASDIRYNTYTELMKKYKGIRPRDIEEQVTAIADPKNDKLYAQTSFAGKRYKTPEEAKKAGHTKIRNVMTGEIKEI